MKKVLFATTALVLSAGFASAQVNLSGDARMGLMYNDTATNTLTQSSRMRVNMTAGGETDGGLTWGATVRNSQGSAAADVSIGGAFGTLTMGSPDGADSVANKLSDVGFTGLGVDNQVEGNTSSSVGDSMISYAYSGGGFSAGISGDLTASIVAVGVGYSAHGLSVGLG